MEKLEIYDIDLKNSEESLRTYSYTVDSDFFEMIDAPRIKKGNLDVKVDVKKGIGYFDIYFQIEGVVECECDRCLGKMDVDVDVENTLKVKLGMEYDDSNDDILTIPESEGILNIAWFIYEFIVLSLPYRLVHDDGECDEVMIESLSRVLTTDLREEDGEYGLYDDETDGCQDSTDPRWDALKKILNNN